MGNDARVAVLVANLRSRGTSQLYARARTLLAQRGIVIEESHEVSTAERLRKRVRRAIRAGHELVVVGGGDGSFTTVVGEFAHREAVLGVLPFGTGNSFARSLGIPPILERAVDTIANGKVARVDLGVVNGRYFANFATIGLSSTIARRTPSWLKKALGPAAYVAAGIVPLLQSSAFESELQWKRGRLRLSTHQLIVANGRYYGLVPLAPDATIVDGTLSVFTTEDLSRWDVARMFVAFSRGVQTRLAEATSLTTSSLTVRTNPKQPLDVDGEALGRTPAHFAVATKALRVLVPPDFTGR